MPRGDGTGPTGAGAGTGRGRAGGGRGASGVGRGLNNGPLAAGPGGVCVCPQCGVQVNHVLSQPCMQTKCPSCGATMTRG